MTGGTTVVTVTGSRTNHAAISFPTPSATPKQGHYIKDAGSRQQETRYLGKSDHLTKGAGCIIHASSSPSGFMSIHVDGRWKCSVVYAHEA